METKRWQVRRGRERDSAQYLLLVVEAWTVGGGGGGMLGNRGGQLAAGARSISYKRPQSEKRGKDEGMRQEEGKRRRGKQ